MKHSTILARLAGCALALAALVPATAIAATEPAGSLAASRSGFTAVPLADGRALVAGGFGTTGLLFTAEVFNPATATFSGTGSLITRRGGHAGARLPDGRVLIVGGAGPGDATSGTLPLAKAEIWDPATGTWSAAPDMSVARRAPKALALLDGRVLVIAGDEATAAACEIYDPATGTFSTTGSLTTAREAFAASVLEDGRVLVVGGYRSFTYHATAEVWDPSTGTWSAAVGTMPQARLSPTATLLSNGLVLVAGGQTGVSTNVFVGPASLFDPATGTFTTTGSLAQARSEQVAARLADGRVVVAGGRIPVITPIASIEMYDPATGTWSSGGALTDARRSHSAAMLGDGSLLVAGGYNASLVTLYSAEIIDPACMAGTPGISPATASFTNAAATGSVAVTQVAGCFWRATGSTGWLSITSGYQGFGDGTVSYSVAANTGFARSATMTIAQNAFTVSQEAGPCAASSLSPASQSFTSGGGASSTSLTIAADCPWSVSGVPSWVTIASGGNGPGAIAYSVAANSGPARSATLTIASTSFVVSQSATACSPAPTISPSSVTVAIAGGYSNVSINAPPTCSWNVTDVPSWIGMTTSGTGYTYIDFYVYPNPGAQRSAVLTVAGRPFTVTQLGDLCVGATLTPSSLSLTNAAGSGTIAFSAPAACTWSISGTPSWMSFPSGSSGTGSATISYSAVANSGAARSASLTIAGRSLSVSQAASACWPASTISPSSVAIAIGGGTGSVSVTSQSACTWNVTGVPAWITVTSALPVTGSGTFTYTVAANSGVARSATLVIAGASYVVNQSGVAPPPSYCASSGSTSSYEWIQSMSLAGVTLTSGNNGGYLNQTSMWTFALTRSGLNPIALAPGFSSGSYTEFWRVWIDFNQDQVFSDSELVYGGQSNGTLNGAFTIPTSALSGNTRMRISMRYSSSPLACGPFPYGEVEDFTVNIP